MPKIAHVLFSALKATFVIADLHNMAATYDGIIVTNYKLTIAILSCKEVSLHHVVPCYTKHIEIKY